MPIKVFKPTSPGRRGMIGLLHQGLTKKEPEKSLLLPSKRQAGRNSQGKLSVRHRGGGAKRQLRIIDFSRDKLDIPGRVAAIEYDPNRNAHIALIHYPDGEKRYILAALGLKVGDSVMAGEKAEPKPGNSLPLRAVPIGIPIHNLEIEPGHGGQLVRSAGTAAQVQGREDIYILVRLPSGEIRRFHPQCRATIGQVGNADFRSIIWGNAGRVRHRGRRPTVRGSAMSPRDHPHGGGEGRSPIGMPGPKTPWSKPALGVKTRSPQKPSDRLVVRRRR